MSRTRPTTSPNGSKTEVPASLETKILENAVVTTTRLRHIFFSGEANELKNKQAGRVIPRW